MRRLRYLYNSQLITAGIAVICFIALALNYQNFASIDSVVQVLAANQSEWVRMAAIFVTALGDQWVLVPLVLIVVAIELFKIKSRPKAFLMLSSLVSLPMFYLCKITIERARPVTEFVNQAGLHGYSFPSGHATGSFVVYAVLAYILYTHLKKPWSLAAAVGLGLLIVFIGLSRVYLGAHYPSDILGGWLLGSAIFLIITFVYKKLIEVKGIACRRSRAEDSALNS